MLTLICCFTKYLSKIATKISRIATRRETSKKLDDGKVPNLIAYLNSTADPRSSSTTVNSSRNDHESFDYIGDESDSMDATNGNLHWA